MMRAKVLHDRALAAAAGVVVVAVNLHLVVRTLGLRGVATLVAGHVFVVFPDLAHDVVEGVVDVDSRFGRRLDELAAEALCELLALCKEKQTVTSAHSIQNIAHTVPLPLEKKEQSDADGCAAKRGEHTHGAGRAARTARPATPCAHRPHSLTDSHARTLCARTMLPRAARRGSPKG